MTALALQLYLNDKTKSLMWLLGPTFYLIGSVPERTRWGEASEIDLTNRLEGLKPDYFQLESGKIKVTSDGKKFFGT